MCRQVDCRPYCAIDWLRRHRSRHHLETVQKGGHHGPCIQKTRSSYTVCLNPHVVTMRLLPALLALLALTVAVLLAQRPRAPAAATEPGSGAFFDEVAPRYDLLNTLLSLGLAGRWRAAAAAAAFTKGEVLDVSTGTAELALELARRGAVVTGVDPSLRMLEAGRAKCEGKGVVLVEGVVESLPFEDGRFGAVAVAFGVRNFDDRTRGLGEMARVAAPGARVVILEASTPRGDGILDRAGRVFIREVMPRVGAFVSGNPAAYEYLSKSMAEFPDADEFKAMMESAGLVDVKHERLEPFGLGADLYTAVKPAAKSATSDSETSAQQGGNGNA